MSIAMHEGREAEPSRADKMLDELRLRIADTVGELKPKGGLFDLVALQDRLFAVAEELHDIERQLRMVVHIAQLDSGVLEDRIQEIEKNLADGWKPPARSAEDIIAEYRRRT